MLAIAAADVTAAALSILQQLREQPVASACGCDAQQQAALDAAVAELQAIGAVHRCAAAAGSCSVHQ